MFCFFFQFKIIYLAPLRTRSRSAHINTKEIPEPMDQTRKNLAKLKLEHNCLQEECKNLKKENKSLKKKLKLKQKERDTLPPALHALNDSHEKNVSAAASQGRRWSLDIKLLALNIYRRGPRAYTYLRDLLATSIPTIATILSLSRLIDVNVGINHVLFDALTKKSREMQELDRHCVLLFDEISIKPRLLYDDSKDKIIGYQDYGKDMPDRVARWL